MRYYLARGATDTNFSSAKTLYVNNCGFYKNVSVDMHINRKNGRSDYQIIYIENGKMCVYTQAKTITLQKGDIYLYQPRIPQNYFVAKENQTCYYWIHFSGTGTTELLQKAGLQTELYHTTGFYEFPRTCEKISKALITKSVNSEIYSSAMLAALLSMVRDKSTKSKKFYEVIERMTQEGYSVQTANSDFAKMYHLSEYHFIHLFTQAYNMSPHEYKIQIYMDKAKQLLSDTELPVGEIAQELGFSDSLYFTRRFKIKTGLSPTQYRLSFISERA